MAGYTRQSSFSDGDTIAASLLNNEYDQLLSAFNVSSGHTHDGSTTGDGGPLSTLYSNAISFGTGADTDIVVTFNANTADGVLTWMEDEDYFKFSDDILINSTEKVQFRDTGLYIYSSADGQLDLVADTEIQIAATTIDINGNVDISGNLVVAGTTIAGGEIAVLDGVTAGTVTASKALVVDSNKDIASLRNITLTGELDAGSLDVSGDVDIDGTLEADAITIDGVTLSETIADTVGAMVGSNTETGITVTYEDGDNTLDFVIGSSSVTNDMLAGSIADSKLSTISTAGKVDIGALEIDGATDIGGALADADLIIVDDGAGGTERKSAMSRVSTYVESKISGDITISGGTAAIGSGVIVNADINSSAAIADSKLATISTADKVSGAAIQIDGATDGTSITLADADKFLVDDGGTTKYISASQLNSYTSSSIALDDVSTGDAAVTLATSAGNITIDAQGSDTDIIFKGTDGSSDTTFLTIDGSEAGAATFNNKIVATELDISGDVDIDGTLETDALTINGTTLSETIADTVGAMVSSNTETGIAVTYEDGDNTLDFALGAAQTTITSLLATDIKIGEDDQTKIDFETADEIHFYAANAEQVYVADGIFGPQTDSDVDLGSNSVRWKDAYVDSVTTTGAVTVGGNLTVNGTTTTVNSTTTTVDDPVFTLGGDSAPGSDDNKDRGIEFRWHNGSAAKLGFFGYDDSASAFTFVPDSTNSSEVFSGTVGNAIFGDITGTLQTAAQANITSLGTLTALTVDNVSVNGATIGHTSDTDLITLADGVVTVAGEISATTLDIGGTNISATAAELNIMDGVTASTSELNIMDGVTATTAELNIMDGVTSTATELNIMDGDTSATSTTLADADRVVVNDAGTMKQVAMTDVTTYINSNASFASQGFSIAMSVAL